MAQDGIREIPVMFNDAINSRDIDALAALMTLDHRFIDTAGMTVDGKEACVAAWTGFFAAFPDYRNYFELIDLRGDLAVIAGRSSCSDPRLDGPALWTAVVRDNLVAEWRVYTVTPENRAAHGITD
jgi:ketosteroid isomerase-like protein